MSEYKTQGENNGEVVHVEELTSSPAAADLNKWKIYPKPDGWYIIDDAGTEIKLAFGTGFLPSSNDFRLFDDFVSGSLSTGEIGEKGWNRSGGIGVIGVAAEMNHPGIIQINATAVLSVLFLADVGGVGGIHPADDFNLETILRPSAAGNITNQMRRFGMAKSPTASSPANGIYFEYDTDNADTNWQAVARSSSVQTKVNTGVAAATGSFIRLEIKRNGSSIDFLIDGTVKATISTNIPTTALDPFYQQIKRSGAGNPVSDIDFFGATIPDLGR